MSLPYTQDMPPAGGFETIRYKRSLPVRGPGTYTVLGVVTGLMLYGCWRVSRARIEQTELAREKAWARIHLVPLLLAEADRDAFRRQQMQHAREAAIMRNVPGWKVDSRGYNEPKGTGSKIGLAL
ncbi:hypothetical protein AURDEDRAFT_110630 [Auricularia subglabra TFB-10046 SS5]|nr:hypothetical protein AURDEDRAFT_110630 [Auricularia subglabra TFB-10046 SS5]